jgi:hypothetical protein
MSAGLALAASRISGWEAKPPRYSRPGQAQAENDGFSGQERRDGHGDLLGFERLLGLWMGREAVGQR